MTSHPKKIQEMVEEEILRFLEERSRGDSSPVRPKGERIILLVLSSPLPGDAFVPQLATLTKRYPCALLKAEHTPLDHPTDSAGPLANLPQFPPSNSDPPSPQALKQIKAMILLYPSLALLARTALGLDDDSCTRLILHALWSDTPVIGIRGKPFHTLSSAEQTMNHGSDQSLPSSSYPPLPNSIQALIHQYEKALEDWGVKWIKGEQIFPAVEKVMEDSPAHDREQAPPNTPARIIVTAEDVEERIKRGEGHWDLPKDAIITAVARESAEKKGFIFKTIS